MFKISSLTRRVGKKIESLPLRKRLMLEKVVDLLLIIRTIKDIRRYRNLLRAVETTTFEVKPDQGFAKFDVPNFDPCIFIEFANTLKNEYLQRGSINQKNSKEYLQQIANLETIAKKNEIIEFALSGSILKSVANYFGKYPILHDISVFYSPANAHLQTSEKKFQGSQLFHRDGGGTRCLKLWILCEDVSSDNGPTTLLPADISDAVCERLKYTPGKKFETDEPLNNVLSYSIKLIGKAGDWFATDTDRCLHYGSRTKKESSRLVMMFHFVDRNSLYYLPLIRNRYFKRYTDLNLNNSNFPSYSKDAIRFR